MRIYNSQTPAKEAVLSKEYDFLAKKTGNINGLAKGALKVAEVLPINFSNDIANFSKDITWEAFAEDLSVEILINNAPVGQQEYYLGQKISLSYRLRKSSKDYLKLENPKWQVSGATIKEHDIWFGDGLPTLISDEEFASESLNLFLYCTDEENFSKNISIEGQLFNRTIATSTHIEIKHPDWVDSSLPIFPQPVLNHYIDTPYKVYYLGYKEDNEDYPVFEPTINNSTKITFLIACLQLVINNHRRKETNNGIPAEEVAKTYPSGEFWLDAKFPFLWFKSIQPSSTEKLVSLYQDPPIVELDDKAPIVVSDVVADADYLLFIMAKPATTDLIPLKDSIWVPIKSFKWHWQGQAQKDAMGNWVKGPIAILASGPKVIKYDEIVKWKKVGVASTTDEIDEDHIKIKWVPKL